MGELNIVDTPIAYPIGHFWNRRLIINRRPLTALQFRFEYILIPPDASLIPIPGWRRSTLEFRRALCSERTPDLSDRVIKCRLPLKSSLARARTHKLRTEVWRPRRTVVSAPHGDQFELRLTAPHLDLSAP
jgi:hypothetical protein